MKGAMRMVLNNITELAKWYGEEDEDRLPKAIYKGTECGAWIQWDNATVTIGSIVEGSDAEFAETFTFPVSSETVEEWLEELEDLTDAAWHEANDGEGEEDA